ncbi:MAG: hypothetical protein CSA75_02820 [Sorangium cellulosum]|nr:MAG: hypothetical protein CSA75_02820 [Sorangium cellulosum]
MQRLMQISSVFSWCSVLSACAALGCSGTQPSPQSATQPRAPDAIKATEKQGDGLATLIASVPSGTLGPYVGYGSEGAIILFSPPSEDSPRKWLVQALDKQGAPVDGPFDIGTSPDDVPFAVVRALTEGYVALWVRQVNQADVLEGILLDKKGVRLGSINTMTQANGRVVWADAFPTKTGTIVSWAEQSEDRARVKTVKLDSTGKADGNGIVVAHDVRAWEAVALDNGAAIALVVANEQDENLGSVVLQRLDASGKALGGPVAISKSNTARLDVGLVRTGRSLVMAWTDRGDSDSVVHTAATDLNGRLMVAPRAPLPPLGDQALVALIAPSHNNPNKALLVYEQLPSAGGARELKLATVGAEALVSGQTVTLSFAPVGRPIADFGRTDDGFVLLTRSQICNEDGICDGEKVPWYIRLGSDLSVHAGTPLVFDILDGGVPSAVWAPGCTSKACMALAVGGHDPAQIVAAKLPSKSIAPGIPARLDPPARPPRPRSNRAVIASNEPLSEIDVAKSGGMTFVGWVSHFVEGLGGTPRKPPPGAPGDARKPMAAHLAVQRLDDSGSLIEDPTIVSVRAMSAGGVALAPNAKGTEVCVAWVAKDNGDPQLFLTRIDKGGKRKLQRMISRARGDASDVSIAPYGDGWIVAWVDWRDGNGEVYITRVNSMLVRLAPEKRITNAGGDASDVSLLVVGDEVLVAYGDSRDHAPHGTANPYIQKLKASNLERMGEERRVAASALHAKGVALGHTGKDVVIGWLEQAPPQTQGGARAGARVTRFDTETLRPMGDPSNLGTNGASAPISLGLRCAASVCRGAMMIPTSEGLNMEGFSWFPKTSEVHRGQLARLSGPAASDVAPAVMDNIAYFVDRSDDGRDRIRRVEVEWIK